MTEKEKEKETEREGTPLPFEIVERGAGEPVVFVHGSASDRRTWDQQVEVFAAEFRVLTFSRRHHWPNEPIAEGTEYSMSRQVEDLKRVLESLQGQRAHLVGHSYGAYLGLLVAMENPALIASLVLAEPPVIPLFTSFPPRPREILKLLLTRPATGLPIVRFAATGLGPATSAARRGDTDAAMKHFGKAVLGGEAYRALSQRRLEQIRVNFHKAEFLSDSFMTPLDAAEVSTVDAPTLLVTGADSPPLFHRLADRLEELIADTARVDIPNASHIMHEDNAAAYNQALGAFLRDRASRPHKDEQ